MKELIEKLNEIGYNDDTEVVFNIKNSDEETFKDCYCQFIYALMPFTLNAIGIEIDDVYKN